MVFPAEITARETLELLKSGENVVVIDIRDDASFNAGHIPGALSIPANGFDLGKVKVLAKPDTRIVISCFRGMMSRDVVAYLRKQGFTNAQSMGGGWDGWLKIDDAPIERS